MCKCAFRIILSEAKAPCFHVNVYHNSTVMVLTCMALFKTIASAFWIRCRIRPLVWSPEQLYAQHAQLSKQLRGQASLKPNPKPNPSFRKGPIFSQSGKYLWTCHYISCKVLKTLRNVDNQLQNIKQAEFFTGNLVHPFVWKDLVFTDRRFMRKQSYHVYVKNTFKIKKIHLFL